jgi:hypothetical protein
VDQDAPPPENEAVRPVFEQLLAMAQGRVTVRRYAYDADPKIFGRLASMARHWQSERRGTALPRWRDFDFEEFVGWHRYISLSDLPEGKADRRYRISGSAGSELVGFDMTNKSISEAFPGTTGESIFEHFAQIRDHKLVGLLSGRLGKENREFIQFMMIELPLVNDAGEVSQILHAFYRLPQDE